TASSPDEAKENFDEDAYVKESSFRSFAVIAALLVLYVAAFKPLGFILSSVAFLFCAMLFLTPKEKRNWIYIVALSVIIPIAVYFLFVSGFRLKLPAGILNF
ncbi:MAG: tripartite tricarboxylate transporter TctB family protein, partial [Anaerovorax sp.]